MRNVRCSGHLVGGGCLPRGVSAPVGMPRVCVFLGGCLPGGGGVCPGVSADTPHLDRMAETCEKITFPQLLLRPVKTGVRCR